MSKCGFFIFTVILLTSACSPSTQIREEIQERIWLTQTALPTSTITPTPSITPSTTPTYTPTPTPTYTPTETFTPSPTLTPSVTATFTPSPTFTASPTPVLPPLVDLLLTGEQLNSVVDLWRTPGEDLTEDLKELNKRPCSIDCTGVKWTSRDYRSNLSLTLYREKDPQAALLVTISSQSFYLQRKEFVLQPLPPNIALPEQTWLAIHPDQSFVLITTQGSGVVTLFWQSDIPQIPGQIGNFISSYASLQLDVLKENGFITPSDLTPPEPPELPPETEPFVLPN